MEQLEQVAFYRKQIDRLREVALGGEESLASAAAIAKESEQR